MLVGPEEVDFVKTPTVEHEYESPGPPPEFVRVNEPELMTIPPQAGPEQAVVETYEMPTNPVVGGVGTGPVTHSTFWPLEQDESVSEEVEVAVPWHEVPE